MTRLKIAMCLGAALLVSQAASGAEVTANVTLQRGQIISASDIKLSPENMPNATALRDRFIGQQMRRTVYVGARLSPNHVERPTLVRRNSRVNMIYRMGRLEMSATGRALDEGAEGDIISVMNLESKLRVDGHVLANGNIEVIK